MSDDLCACGANDIDEETDAMTNATMIECLSCGRVVGAATKVEARRMWNAAMREAP